jgi:hypothetical protein
MYTRGESWRSGNADLAFASKDGKRPLRYRGAQLSSGEQLGVAAQNSRSAGLQAPFPSNLGRRWMRESGVSSCHCMNNGPQHVELLRLSAEWGKA